MRLCDPEVAMANSPRELTEGSSSKEKSTLTKVLALTAAAQRPDLVISYLLGIVKIQDTMHREDKIGGAPMKTVTISLPESLKGFVERQIATKDYGNVSEYFRTLLREARAREEDARLEALLVEGLASGEEIPLTKEFWRELKSEATGIARKHRARKKL